MTPQQIQTTAPLFAAGLFAFAMLLFLVSLRYFRKSRTDFYWRRRRTAGQRGWRIFVWSVIFTLMSGVICMAAGVAGLAVARNASPTAVRVSATTTSGPKQTSTTPATEFASTEAVTSLASIAASKAAPQTAAATLATFEATDTVTSAVIVRTAPSTATEAAPLVATLESSVTPSADARLMITALSTQISPKFAPVEPGNDFAAGFARIYYFVSFSGMQSGVLWKRQLVMDSKLIEENTSLWGLAEEGTGYFFFEQQESGFKPGYYEVRLFIGNTAKPAATVGFQVK